MWSVKGRNALVTGAGSGIGKALALELARSGANVAVTDIAGERLPSLVREISSLGVRAEPYTVDHGDREQTLAFHAQYMKDWGRADILCLNAGIAAAGPVEDLEEEDWTRTLNVNLWGPVQMVRLFVPDMIGNGFGGILITASMAGIMAVPGLSPYNTSKFAMVGFAESLHFELACHGIHVCALCPGVINTNIVSESRMRFDKKGDPGTHDRMVRFYATWGADPARVARHGLRGLAKNRCVQPSPVHSWVLYYLKRFFPGAGWRISRFVWGKGWVR